MNNERTFGGIITPYFKIYYRAVVIQISLIWHKSRQIDQNNRTEDADINPHTYKHSLIFDKVKNTYCKKKDEIFKY